MEEKDYSATINGNAILLSFEGWIKYIEGFTRGLQTTKMVDASSVMDCIGEILEYMQTLRGNLFALLQHCEIVLEENEKLKQEIEQLKTSIAKEDENGEEVSEL